MKARKIISKAVLLPMSKIYGAVVYVRNKLFDLNILHQHTFDVPIIVVGNIAVGGTGKTPHVEFLIDLLRHSYHIGVLSRGYKRHTKGFVIATDKSTPTDIGDESYQIYSKYGQHGVVVAVCEDRVQGIKEMQKIDPNINLFILDDAFQHRYVKPTVSIVLTEVNRPFYNDKLLPYGRLRESKKSIKRADFVFVTKCTDKIKPIEYNLITKDIDLVEWQGLYFTKYVYTHLRPVFPDMAPQSAPYLDWLTEDDSVLSITGIDNPKPFVRFIKSFKSRVRVNVFPDHHVFSRKDINLIKQRFDTMQGNRKYIVTTEKDAVRMSTNPYFPHELKPYTFYLPIKVECMRNETASFESALRNLLRTRN